MVVQGMLLTTVMSAGESVVRAVDVDVGPPAPGSPRNGHVDLRALRGSQRRGARRRCGARGRRRDRRRAPRPSSAPRGSAAPAGRANRRPGGCGGGGRWWRACGRRPGTTRGRRVGPGESTPCCRAASAAIAASTWAWPRNATPGCVSRPPSGTTPMLAKNRDAWVTACNDTVATRAPSNARALALM